MARLGRMEAGLPTSRRRWWGRVNLVENGGLAAFCKGIKLRDPLRGLPGSHPEDSMPMSFILKMGHSLDVGKDKTKSTDVLECLHKTGHFTNILISSLHLRSV